MMPLVSILIPCHNAAPYVADALESALAQTWQNKEIILINDGSTDDSFEIAQQFVSRGIRVLSQENKGASAARNTALSASSGDYIQYLDADDLLGANKLTKQLAALKTSPEAVASCPWGRFRDTLNEAIFRPEQVWKDMPAIQWLVCSWSGGGMMHPAAWLVPRSVAERAGPWNEELSLNDDGEYFTRILLASTGVRFCPSAQTFYRSRLPQSLSASASRRAYESGLKVCQLQMQNLLAHEDSRITRRACADNLQRFIYSVYPRYPDLVTQVELQIAKLGGSQLRPDGSAVFRLLTRILGWKATQRLRQLKSWDNRSEAIR
jgi:glycosyltransferase involved in cell wall biosynthesis